MPYECNAVGDDRHHPWFCHYKLVQLFFFFSFLVLAAPQSLCIAATPGKLTPNLGPTRSKCWLSCLIAAKQQ